jgi:hypothetical protein
VNRDADGAARLLGWAVRLLPARRREWGRAMQAELAAIEPGPERRRFALTCTRAALSRPATVVKVGRPSLVAVAVAGTVVMTGAIRPATIRLEAIAMVVGLAALPWLARRLAIFGPVAPGRTARLVSAGGFAVIATDVLIFIDYARRSPGGEVDGDVTTATTLIAIWTAMLSIYAIALVRMTARRSSVATHTLATGAGIGVAAAAAWLTAAFLDPGVPTSSGPAVVAIAAAAVGAEWVSSRRSGLGLQSRVAGLSAAAGAALLIAVLIDGPLRLSSLWVANSAPPVYPPVTADRLVDSIGVWLLGSLLATALSLTIRTTRQTARRAEASDAPAVVSTHVT